VKTELDSCHDRARFLIAGYNDSAETHRLEPIDTDAIEEYKDSGVKNLIDQWCAFAHSDDLLTRGRRFEARDVLISWLEDRQFII